VAIGWHSQIGIGVAFFDALERVLLINRLFDGLESGLALINTGLQTGAQQIGK
jgi:hypothetical protein